ncbi:MAG: carboxypeptidase regulatory-like domain-containing protein [Acidobacteria bacterium]|nr:carboxypeptidase regulatory-like domain-containing protein [Acidobacteriota bacterium]
MPTRPLETVRRVTAVLVTVFLGVGPGFAVPGSAQSPSPEMGHGSIRGNLYQADERTALAGAKVTAIDVRTGKQYESEVTMDNGDYLIDGVPAGTYDVVIEVGGNLFVADRLVDLGPNESASRSYSVQPEKPAGRVIAKKPAPKGSATLVGEADVPAGVFWRTPGGIVLLSVLGAGAVAIIVNNTGHKDRGSPSAP